VPSIDWPKQESRRRTLATRPTSPGRKKNCASAMPRAIGPAPNETWAARGDEEKWAPGDFQDDDQARKCSPDQATGRWTCRDRSRPAMKTRGMAAHGSLPLTGTATVDVRLLEPAPKSLRIVVGYGFRAAGGAPAIAPISISPSREADRTSRDRSPGNTKASKIAEGQRPAPRQGPARHAAVRTAKHLLPGLIVWASALQGHARMGSGRPSFSAQGGSIPAACAPAAPPPCTCT